VSRNNTSATPQKYLMLGVHLITSLHTLCTYWYPIISNRNPLQSPARNIIFSYIVRHAVKTTIIGVRKNKTKKKLYLWLISLGYMRMSRLGESLKNQNRPLFLQIKSILVSGLTTTRGKPKENIALAKTYYSRFVEILHR